MARRKYNKKKGKVEMFLDNLGMTLGGIGALTWGVVGATELFTNKTINLVEVLFDLPVLKLIPKAPAVVYTVVGLTGGVWLGGKWLVMKIKGK